MANEMKNQKVSPAAFLDYLAGIEGRAEYREGEIVDIPGSTMAHSTIVANVLGELNFLLKRSNFQTHGLLLLVKIPDGSLVFPDVFVMDSPAEHALSRDGIDIVTNPVLVVEVLSKTRIGYTSGGNFYHYRQIAILKEFVLVDQYSICVTIFRITEDGNWDIQTFGPETDEIHFQSVNVKVPMTEIYLNVEFQP